SKTTFESDAIASKPPKIDNSKLLDPACDHFDGVIGSTLLPGLVEHNDYFLVPTEAWDALLAWYGGGPPICRFVVGIGEPSSPQFFTRVEVYPELPSDTSSDVDMENEVVVPAPPTIEKPLLKCVVCSRMSINRCGNCKLNSYCSRTCQTSHWKYHRDTCRAIISGKKVTAMDLVGRRGQTGLRNLGNTCFMNSALQCLSHTPVLTNHFISNRYQDDLNTDNVLGTGGQLATEYGILLKELWFGTASSVTPSALKRSLSRYAPQFSGYQQHDAQELLAYLLDGLHEDVNRIQKKPYIEIQESNGTQPDAVISAQAWHNHCLRNQSIFVETLQGQFKSTVVCPTCSRISITFDPFNVIQLELPNNNNRTFEIIYVPWLTKESFEDKKKSHLGPTKYHVSVSKRGTVGQLNKALEAMGCEKQQFLLCDVFQNLIYRALPDSERVARIRNDDRLVCYNVPAGSSALFCYHRCYTNETAMLFGDPIVITFTQTTTCEDESDLNDNSFRMSFLKLLAKHVFLANQDGANLPDTDSLDNWSEFQPGVKVSTLGLGNSGYLAIDWTDKLQELYQEPSLQNHESVLATKQAKLGGLTLDDCFKKFTSPEELDEDNLWYCSQCKEHRQATKTMELYKLPDILILSLKRFEYRNEVVREKLDMMVDFPLESLDMAPYCHATKENMIYDLYAVTNHYGSMGFGHYTAYAKDHEHNLWYNFDDSSVTAISASQTVTNAAYILFYKRRESTAK
ncbi:ubiquitin-specific protease, partial [Thraustotheca clavata]